MVALRDVMAMVCQEYRPSKGIPKGRFGLILYLIDWQEQSLSENRSARSSGSSVSLDYPHRRFWKPLSRIRLLMCGRN